MTAAKKTKSPHILADILTPSGIATIDTETRNCGNCEHCVPWSGDRWCMIFDEDLIPVARWDGHQLGWRRCAQCVESQVAAG